MDIRNLLNSTSPTLLHRQQSTNTSFSPIPRRTSFPMQSQSWPSQTAHSPQHTHQYEYHDNYRYHHRDTSQLMYSHVEDAQRFQPEVLSKLYARREQLGSIDSLSRLQSGKCSILEHEKRLQSAEIPNGMPEGQRSTTNQKVHACAHLSCKKRFARRSDLSRHERIHSGDKPHKCDVGDCTQAFIQRSALTVHLRTHSGERPHKCFCDKRFSDSSSLARHKRTHVDDRPWVCQHCSRTFTRKTTLRRHYQSHHLTAVGPEGGIMANPIKHAQIELHAEARLESPHEVSDVSDDTSSEVSEASNTRRSSAFEACPKSLIKIEKGHNKSVKAESARFGTLANIDMPVQAQPYKTPQTVQAILPDGTMPSSPVSVMNYSSHMQNLDTLETPWVADPPPAGYMEYGRGQTGPSGAYFDHTTRQTGPGCTQADNFGETQFHKPRHPTGPNLWESHSISQTSFRTNQ